MNNNKQNRKKMKNRAHWLSLKYFLPLKKKKSQGEEKSYFFLFKGKGKKKEEVFETCGQSEIYERFYDIPAVMKVVSYLDKTTTCGPRQPSRRRRKREIWGLFRDN